MAKLSISSSQQTILNNMDGYLESALAEGTQVSGTDFLAAIIGYNKVPGGQRPGVRDSMRIIAAALLKAANIGGSTGFTGTFSTGTQTVTVSNGIITSVV